MSAQQDRKGVLISVYVHAGARMNRITSFRDRFKVAIQAAPEKGKANEAICTFLAKTLDLKKNQVSIYKGHTKTQKIIHIEGLSLKQIMLKINSL